MSKLEAILWVKKVNGDTCTYYDVIVVSPLTWDWTKTSACARELQESVDAAARRVGCTSAPTVEL